MRPKCTLIDWKRKDLELFYDPCYPACPLESIADGDLLAFDALLKKFQIAYHIGQQIADLISNQSSELVMFARRRGAYSVESQKDLRTLREEGQHTEALTGFRKLEERVSDKGEPSFLPGSRSDTGCYGDSA